MERTVEAVLIGVGLQIVMGFGSSEIGQKAVVGPALVFDYIAPEIVVCSVTSGPGCVVDCTPTGKKFPSCLKYLSPVAMLLGDRFELLLKIVTVQLHPAQ